jgi:hypothetical protein
VGDDDAILQLKHGQLAARLRSETEEVLNRQEEQVIASVMAKLTAGETLEPQYAVQQWLALHAIHRFRRALLKKEQRGLAASSQLRGNLTTQG